MNTQQKAPAHQHQGQHHEYPEKATGHGNYTAPIVKLLSRLDRVRETGKGQSLACCPAHDDKSPSLSIKECSDGTVLIHCFGGCEAADILAAVGLELGDLFPQQFEARPKSRYERRVNPMDALRALAHESLVVSVIASDIRQRREVDDTTMQRLVTAANRISSARGLYR